MLRWNNVVLGGAAAAMTLAAPAAAQCEIEELVTSTLLAPTNFGMSTEISGDYAAIGSLVQNEIGVQVFQRFGVEWMPVELVMPRVGTNFSGVMDMEHGVLCVDLGNDGTYGAGNPNAPAQDGECDVFDLNVPGGFVQQTLRSNDGEGNQRFGAAVSVGEDRIVIGAPGDSEAELGAGAVYVFERVDGLWTQTAKLLPEDPTIAAGFGSSLDLDGDRLVVAESSFVNILPAGIPIDATTAIFLPIVPSHRVYVYELRMGQWQQTVELTADDRFTSFGRSLAIDGNTILVGALIDESDGTTPSDPLPGTAPPTSGGTIFPNPVPFPTPFSVTSRGTVLEFEKSGQTWSFVDHHVPNDSEEGDLFGQAIELAGDWATISSPTGFSSATSAGRAYLFRDTAQGWRQAHRYVGADDGSDRYGTAIAMEEEFVIVGAPGFTNVVDGFTKIYGIGPDCSGNGVPDSCDIAMAGMPDSDGDLEPNACEDGDVTPFCEATLNSRGIQALLDGQGPTSLSADSFALVAEGLAPDSIGMFFVSDATMKQPFGSGFRCVGGGTTNVQFSVNANADGELVQELDLSSPMVPFAAFTGWNVQLAYRDGDEVHLTNALEITFIP